MNLLKLGKMSKLVFQNKVLKGLLFIELRKYEGQALGLSLKEKYLMVKAKRF